MAIRSSGALRIPHFLRVTQALALVSGIGAPAAPMLATVDCGGSSDVVQGSDGSDDGNSNGAEVGSASGGGVMPAYDGSPAGVVAMPHDSGLDAKDEVAMGGGVMADTGVPNDATKPAEDAPFDVVVFDVVNGISIPPDAPYEGRPMGVIIMRDASSDTSFPGIQIPPEGGFDVQGGPAEPPELPA